MEEYPPGRTNRINTTKHETFYNTKEPVSPASYQYDFRDEHFIFEHLGVVSNHASCNDAWNNDSVPPANWNKQNDTIPTTLLIAKSIQHKESKRLLRVLFDSGGTNTLIHSGCIPLGATPSLLTERQSLQTIAGTFLSKRQVGLQELSLPEFDSKKRISGVNAFVFDSPCNYDIILGRDFLSMIGLTLDFKNHTMKWMDSTIQMKNLAHT